MALGVLGGYVEAPLAAYLHQMLTDAQVQAPYGFAGVYTTAAVEKELRRYVEAPITMFLGDEDTEEEGLNTSAEARAQGATRQERGHRTFKAARELAQARGWSFRGTSAVAGATGTLRGREVCGVADPKVDRRPVGTHVGTDADPLWWSLAAVTLIWLVSSARWLLSDSVVPWDSKNQSYAFFRFLANTLHSGATPFWNPYHYGGHPSVADPQSLIFSPAFLLAWFDAVPSFQRVDAFVLGLLGLGGFAILLFFRDRGWHPAGAMVGFLDGHVQGLTKKTDPHVLKRLAIRDDGGKLPSDF